MNMTSLIADAAIPLPDVSLQLQSRVLDQSPTYMNAKAKTPVKANFRVIDALINQT